MSDFETAADRILETFIFSKPERSGTGDKESRLPLTALGEIEPINMWPHAVYDDKVILRDVSPTALWPVDVAFAADKSGSLKHRGVFICRLETANLKDVRGQINIAPKFLGKLTSCTIENGKYYTEINYVGFVGEKWRPIERSARIVGIGTGGSLRRCYQASSGTITQDIDSTLAVTMGLALTRRYDWTVSIRLDDSPTILFSTDPTGAREIFRLRDIPDGRSRRAALRHWVCEHYRKKREGDAKVRRHFRGAETFNWNGFECTIRPSRYDLERLSLELR